MVKGMVVGVGLMLPMLPGSQSVDCYRQLIDGRVIHLIVEENLQVINQCVNIDNNEQNDKPLYQFYQYYLKNRRQLYYAVSPLSQRRQACSKCIWMHSGSSGGGAGMGMTLEKSQAFLLASAVSG